MSASAGAIHFDTLEDMRVARVADGTVVLLVGKDAFGDGLGGFYRWDDDATGDDDLAFMNTLTSDVSETGRWVRIFQRARAMPQGALVVNGGVRTLYANGTTDSNGEITVNLTMENTSGGTAIFTEIWSSLAEATSNASGPNDVIVGMRKSVAGNLKTITYRFARGNSTTLGATILDIAGTVILGLRAAPEGTAVRVKIEGV